MRKKGILLVNLGTPTAPTVKAIRRYLKSFLLDPRVITLNGFFRRLLVYGLILPFRPYRTAKAYRAIWAETGSPLRYHTEQLGQQLQIALGESEYQVETAMRYGEPSIAAALKALSGCDALTVLPLFPQYASASTGSAMAAVMQALAAQVEIPSITFIRQFYALPAFVNAYVQLIRPHLLAEDAFLLMSYHGLPERQIDRRRCASACNLKAPCPIDSQEEVPSCYRAECYASSRAIATGLGLSADRYQTTFQSRLGRLPWIQPYTDETLAELRARGIRHLVVVCPAFVADCLETLEEIGMQSRAHWMALGGETFTLVPCLNADPNWVDGLATWIKTQSP